MKQTSQDNPLLSTSESPVAVSDVVTRAMERINTRSEDPGSLAGISSGFPELDAVIGGLQKSQLIVIGGHSSMGKTSLALSMTEHLICEEYKTVLYVTLDMDELDLMDRLLTSRSRVDAHKIRSSRGLYFEDRTAFDRASIDFRQAPLWIHAPICVTVAQIAAEARRLVGHGELDLIVVDTLQQIEPENPQEHRPVQLARICRQLKQLARELKVPIVALSRLSQGSESRDDHRPRMNDLVDRRAIEEEADVILFLHRPEYYDANDQQGLAELLVVKNRTGTTGTIKLAFLKDCLRFESFASRVNDDREGSF